MSALTLKSSKWVNNITTKRRLKQSYKSTMIKNVSDQHTVIPKQPVIDSDKVPWTEIYFSGMYVPSDSPYTKILSNK